MAGSSAVVRLFKRLHRDLRREAQLVARHPSPAAVHRARVAARRLRSLTSVLTGLRERPAAQRYMRDLRALAHELAVVREADVMREELLDAADGLKGTMPSAHQQLQLLLEQERSAARRDLHRHTRSLIWTERMQRLDEASRNLSDELARAGDGRVLARSMLLETAQALAHSRRQVNGRPRALHRLRIQAKASRYVTEVLGKQLGLDAERLAAPARATQQAVGRYLDGRDARKWLARHRVALDAPLHAELRERLARDEKRAFKSSRRELRKLAS
ncbi:MAG TPA: CHAD domain-containing protein [Steroidobacteraceae bacterium]|nr:CHAD domain-containing protein [Steroidobacteraceae bacterium]